MVWGLLYVGIIFIILVVIFKSLTAHGIEAFANKKINKVINIFIIENATHRATLGNVQIDIKT